MNLQEAVNRSQSEHNNYPDVINSDYGLIKIPELNAMGISSWDRLNRGLKRKVILEIRTFKGISSDAIHFYGKIIVDGVYVGHLDNPEKPKNLRSEELKPYPCLDYKYEFKIKRPITAQEIKNDQKRWGDYYDEGDLVEGFETTQELISDFKEIIKLRFSGDWKFIIQYPRGNREEI